MYKDHYDLSVNPFGMSPDPSFLLLTPCHSEALAGLIYGIRSRKGFVTLIGDAGTGKTTLLHRSLQVIPEIRSLTVNPAVSASELPGMVMRGFGIKDIPASRVEQILNLESDLRQAHEKGLLSVLIVDEAQRLDPDVLEEIRLLTNLETADGKLLQVVLAGQNDLVETLRAPTLKQLKQRIAIRLVLRPLVGVDEVEQYIRHRWSLAGGSGELPFETSAVEAIARYASNIPRTINVVCDNALLLAFSKDAASVTSEHVREVAVELDLAAFEAPTSQDAGSEFSSLPVGEESEQEVLTT